MSFVRSIARMRDKMTKTQFEINLHKCTSNEEQFPDDQLFKEVAKYSYTSEDYFKILQHLEKKLQEKKEKWRKILKALQLINFLVSHGNKRFILDLNKKIFLINALTTVVIHHDGVQRHDPIRKMAKAVSEKIQSKVKMALDPKYKAEVNFLSKPMVKGKNAIQRKTVTRKVNRERPAQRVKKSKPAPKKKENALAGFGDNFLDFDEENSDEEIAEQKRRLKRFEQKKALEKKNIEDLDEDEALRMAKLMQLKQQKEDEERRKNKLNDFSNGFFSKKEDQSKKDPFSGFNTINKDNRPKPQFGIKGFDSSEKDDDDEEDIFGGFNKVGKSKKVKESKNEDPFSGFNDDDDQDDGDDFFSTQKPKLREENLDFSHDFSTPVQTKTVQPKIEVNNNTTEETDFLNDFSNMDLNNSALKNEVKVDNTDLLNFDLTAPQPSTQTTPNLINNTGGIPQVQPTTNLLNMGNNQNGVNINMNQNNILGMNQNQQNLQFNSMVNSNIQNPYVMNQQQSMYNMNQNQAIINNNMNIGMSLGNNMGNMNNMNVNPALLQQHQNLLLLQQQQAAINQMKNATPTNNIGLTFGTSNNIQYAPTVVEKPKAPAPKLKTEEDLLNIDLLNGPQM